jgi:hypothetical protein
MDENSTTPPASHATFLRHILPHEGEHFYCATEFHDKRVANHFFSSVEDLSAFINDSDARGRTCYHACGAFREKTGRNQANSIGAKSLWLDLDLRKNGKVVYASKREAWKAVVDFCKRLSIPLPVFVDSGNGLHCYWVFRDTLSPEEWKTYARGLRHACRSLGLEADPARTCDLASILRTPGTHNRKNGNESLVQVGELVGPYEKEDFAALLAYADSIGTSRVQAHGKLDSTARALAATEYEPADAARIARNCAQIAEFFLSNGYQPEPRWYASLGVMAFCRDGDRVAHNVSKGDKDRYTEQDTQDRLDRLRATLTGATTCARFHDLNPEPCEKCAFWQKIKSPIRHGWTQSTVAQQRNGASTASGIKYDVQHDGTGTGAAASAQHDGTATSGDAELDIEIRRLSGLAPALYERERRSIADRFEMRIPVLDKLVDAARGECDAETRQGHALRLTEPEPWPDAVDGGELLHELVTAMLRYLVMAEDDALTMALWVVHTYVFDLFTCTPRACHFVTRKALREDNTHGCAGMFGQSALGRSRHYGSSDLSNNRVSTAHHPVRRGR